MQSKYHSLGYLGKNLVLFMSMYFMFHTKTLIPAEYGLAIHGIVMSRAIMISCTLDLVSKLEKNTLELIPYQSSYSHYSPHSLTCPYKNPVPEVDSLFMSQSPFFPYVNNIHFYMQTLSLP